MKPEGKRLQFREETSRIGATACVIVTEELITRVKTPTRRRYR